MLYYFYIYLIEFNARTVLTILTAVRICVFSGLRCGLFSSALGNDPGVKYAMAQFTLISAAMHSVCASLAAAVNASDGNKPR